MSAASSPDPLDALVARCLAEVRARGLVGTLDEVQAEIGRVLPWTVPCPPDRIVARRLAELQAQPRAISTPAGAPAEAGTSSDAYSNRPRCACGRWALSTKPEHLGMCGPCFNCDDDHGVANHDGHVHR